MSKRPQTRSSALQQIERVLTALPVEEQLQLGREIKPMGGLPFYLVPAVGLLGLIVELPERDRHELLIDVIALMPVRSRRNLIRYFEQSRANMLGYVMVPESLLEMLQTILKKMIGRLAANSLEAREMEAALLRFSHGSKVRMATVADRIEKIDALLNEGYNRSEIYEQMRLQAEGMMRGRNKTFMEENSMWESYKAGGGCHPKAQRPRGRPRRK